jgi:RES domain-containing protein
MRAYRIADRRFPALDGLGAQRAGGRWNSPGRPVVYTAETFSGAILEILVRMSRISVPKGRVSIEIFVPESLVITVSAEQIPFWDAEDQIASRRFGDSWLESAQSPALLVPSLVTGGMERNLLLNPRHPAFPEIRSSSPKDVDWDARLFSTKRD